MDLQRIVLVMKKHLSIFLLLLSFVFCVSAQEKQSLLFNTFPHQWRSEQLREVDNFLVKLNEMPKAMGFVIFYEGKYPFLDKKERKKMVFPKHGELSCKVQAIRYHINSRRRIPLDNILFIDGGFREEQTIEFWIVPENAELPKPTPTLDEMQYRKGQPFCNYRDFY